MPKEITVDISNKTNKPAYPFSSVKPEPVKLSTKQKQRNILVYLSIIALSAIFAFLLIPTYGYQAFPYLAVGLSFILINTAIFLVKPKKDIYASTLFLLGISIAFFMFYRANPFLTFLNVFASIYVTSYLALYTKISDFTLGSIVFAPFIVLFSVLSTSNIFVLGNKNDYKDQFNKLNPTEKVKTEIIVGLIITFGLLFLVIPLLASANPIFNDILKNFAQKLADILPNIISFSTAIRLLAFLIFIYLLPKLLSYVTLAKDKKFPEFEPNINLWIPKLAMVIILTIFFITQFQLYFSSPETLEALGYSNSEYAREVFAQLTVVAIIIFGLIYLDPKNNKGFSKILTYILASLGIFLTFIALKSVSDYVSNWGFTHKRLYGIVGVFWSITAFVLLILKNLQKKTNSVFLSELLILSISTVFLINVFNFDYIIYHYGKKTSTHEGIDHNYLSRLSTDSESYTDQTKTLVIIINEELSLIDKRIEAGEEIEATEIKPDRVFEQTGTVIKVSEEFYQKHIIPSRNIVRNVRYIDNKYTVEINKQGQKYQDYFDFRTFNVSEYKTYNRIDDERIDRLEEFIDKVEVSE